MSADVEWEDSVFWSEGSRTYRGRAEVEGWLARILEPWESIHMRAEEIAEASDGRVLVGLVLTGRGKESGIETELGFWTVSRIEDGKIAARKAYLERADALEAAGLSD